MQKPIDDSYINSVIKDNQTGNPDPGKTSGQELRELIKRMRDHINTVPLNIQPAGGANYAKILFWSEFPGLKVKVDRYGRPLNAFYDYNILGKDIPDCKTDTEYTLKNYILRNPGLKGLVYQPIWYITTFGQNIDTNTIYPALGSIYQNLEPRLNSSDDTSNSQWTVQGKIPFSSNQSKQPVKFDFTTLLGGSPSDDDIVSLGRYINSLGMEFCLDPWPIGVNRDTLAAGQAVNQQLWRGYLTPDDNPQPGQVKITNFAAFCDSYKQFMTYYPTLMYDNGVDLAVYYIGSEYAAISSTTNEAARRLWIKTLSDVARYYKNLFPNGKAVYAANWQGEMKNSSYTKWNIDELWACPDIDRLGIDYYPPIGDVASDDFGYLTSNLVKGEAADVSLITSSDPNNQTSYAFQQKISTSGGKGKSGLPASPIVGNVGDKNIAGLLNKFHYNSSSSYGRQLQYGDFIKAQPTLLWGNDLTAAFTDVTIVDIADQDIFPEFLGSQLDYGRYLLEIADQPSEDLCYADLANKTLKLKFNCPNTAAPTSITLKSRLHTPADTITAGSVVAVLPGRFQIMVDAASKNFAVNIALNNNGILFMPTSVLCATDQIYDLTLSYNATNISLTINGQLFSQAINSPVLAWQINNQQANTLYAGGDQNGSNKLNCRLIYLELSEPRFGYAAFFEEKYAAGTRTAYQPKPGMITEFGVASISGSNVQTNAVPYADATFVSNPATDLDFSDNGKYAFMGNLDYWRGLASNGVYIKELYVPYGSNGQCDEVGQAVALTVLGQYLEGKGFVDRVAYGFDLRPPEIFLYVNNAQLYFIDSPNFGLGQNLTGKLAGGFDPKDGTNILDRLTPPAVSPLVGNVVDARYVNSSPATGSSFIRQNHSVSSCNFVLTGTNAGNTFNGVGNATFGKLPVSTITPTITDADRGFVFEVPGTYDLKPTEGTTASTYGQLPDGSYGPSTKNITFTDAGEAYQVPVHSVLLESKRWPSSFGSLGYKSSMSQYRISCTFEINNQNYSTQPNAFGIGIDGKNIPYYISTSFLVLSFIDGHLRLKTVRGGLNGTEYQKNADDDVVSSTTLTIKMDAPFTMIYERNRFHYTWKVIHNNQTVEMSQPEGWKGGGKVGTPAIINMGGSFLVTDFKVDYTTCKEIDWLICGASITEGNEEAAWRAVPIPMAAFNAEGGSRPYEFLNPGMQDALEVYKSVSYGYWDFAINGANWARVKPNDFNVNSGNLLSNSLPTYYGIEDINAPSGITVKGDKHQSIDVVNSFFTLPGFQYLFLANQTPLNGIWGDFDPRSYQNWVNAYFGPDGDVYQSGPTTIPAYAHRDKTIIIDTFAILNNPDPNSNNGAGYPQGFSEDNLHPTGSGYLKKTEAQLAVMRPFIDARRIGTFYTPPPQLQAPALAFNLTPSTISVSWKRQKNLNSTTPFPQADVINYEVYIDSNPYFWVANKMKEVAGNPGATAYSCVFGNGDVVLSSGEKHTICIIARSAKYLDSCTNSYLITLP
jgi:hypothetical protein